MKPFRAILSMLTIFGGVAIGSFGGCAIGFARATPGAAIQSRIVAGAGTGLILSGIVVLAVSLVCRKEERAALAGAAKAPAETPAPDPADPTDPPDPIDPIRPRASRPSRRP